MTTLKRNILVATIILSGLVLRLYKIDQPILEYFPERQTQTAEITRNIYANGWSDFWIPKTRYVSDYKEATPKILEFPLYNAAVVSLYRLFGYHLVFGRVVSLFSFLILSFYFAAIARKFSDKKILFPSLIIFVFSPIHVLISRSFQPDEFSLMFLIMSIYYNSFLMLLISGLIKLPSYIFGLLIMLLSKNLIRSAFLYLLFFIPIALWTLRASLIMKNSAYYTLENWFNVAYFFDYKWYFSVFNILHLNVLTTLGLLFFLLGIIEGWSVKSMELWRKWLLASLIYIVIFNYNNSTHEYYSLFILPPMAAFSGLGILKISNLITIRNKLLKKVSICLIFFLITAGLIIPSLARIHNFDLNSVNPILIERYDKLF